MTAKEREWLGELQVLNGGSVSQVEADTGKENPGE